MNHLEKIASLFTTPVEIIENQIFNFSQNTKYADNQFQTKDIFSDKWEEVDKYDDVQKLYEFQFDWFLSLYGFKSENDLCSYLKNAKIIIDTGCGLGYKSAWFAKLAPHALVIGIDLSDSLDIASKNYKNIPNLFFYKCDISSTLIKESVIDFVVCDQVIMHTQNPVNTFKHLSDITSINGEFACYVYSKKALPRELVDDHFRKLTHLIGSKEMWEFSSQLTELGKRLSELNVSFESPDIPLLGIKGGVYDIQRFIYWNFIKCFWKPEWGFELSKSTNFDWYAPSNAQRFSKEEFISMIKENNLQIVYLHEEEACYSGLFSK